MISLQRSMHSSQMYTPGPAMSFLTWRCDLPQKLHRSCSFESVGRATEFLPRREGSAPSIGAGTAPFSSTRGQDARKAKIRREPQSPCRGGRISRSVGLEGEHECHLLHVAPAPVLARLRRADQGMALVVEVGGGVAIRGVVAAADLAAHQALAEMDPAPSDLEALLAPLDGVGKVGDVDLIEMRADFGHGQRLRLCIDRPSKRR